MMLLLRQDDAAFTDQRTVGAAGAPACPRRRGPAAPGRRHRRRPRRRLQRWRRHAVTHSRRCQQDKRTRPVPLVRGRNHPLHERPGRDLQLRIFSFLSLRPSWSVRSSVGETPGTQGTWERMGKDVAETSAAMADRGERHRRPRLLPLPN